MPASTAQTAKSALRYARASLLIFAFILTSAVQPADLLTRVAERESENEAARSQYTYRQSVVIADLDRHGAQLGQYREVRDIVFSPTMVRSELLVEQPRNTLKALKLTEEDFRDIREIQPLLITRDNLFNYEVKAKGEEVMEGVDCWVLQVRPRQLLHGMRLFDGMIWVSKADSSIIRLEGQAVPQIRNSKSENLFPHFTTLRQKVEERYWFPVTTFADDTLFFRSGPQRIRMTIRYANYKRFSAESSIEYK
jgi:hypothetical protein